MGVHQGCVFAPLLFTIAFCYVYVKCSQKEEVFDFYKCTRQLHKCFVAVHPVINMNQL